MSAAEDLYRQALALPEDERRELARRILGTVDADPDIAALGAPSGVLAEDDPGFDAELERRAAAFDASAPGVPATDAIAAARARLG